MNKLIIFIVLTISLSYSNSSLCQTVEKPKISFSFDDGNIKDMPNHTLEQWNQLLLDHLKKHEVQAVFFALGSGLNNDKGKYVLNSWNDANHQIGNHTYNHPYFNAENYSLKEFENELLKNDSLINRYSNYTKLFRFPYLKEGNTIKKRDGFRAFMKSKGYRNGHVTIDASDWYVNSRLIKRLKKDPDADISGFKKYYIEHLYDRALYYDSLGDHLVGRKIKHNLLLHHNYIAALFMDDLIQHFKDKGWEVIDVSDAYTDEIYRSQPMNIPAGESLLWALTKQNKKNEDRLRYPAEDSRYEKENMDKLGL